MATLLCEDESGTSLQLSWAVLLVQPICVLVKGFQKNYQKKYVRQ